MEHLHLHCCNDNDYTDDPSSAQADMDSLTSATNKVALYIHVQESITSNFINMYAKTK